MPPPDAADAAAPTTLPSTPETLLPLVLKAMEGSPDARLRGLMASLTTHLHQFVIENAVTEAEFEAAVEFLIGIGQATGPKKNEVILAADLLGVSSLVAVLNNPVAATRESHAALLGPFWRAHAPGCEPGQSIVRQSIDAPVLEVQGAVLGAAGQPLAGATVDVWHASPDGLYENQDAAQPEMNLRGRFTTDAAGRYRLRPIVPAGYPVPTDGPCGGLLRAQQRSAMRPAHLHFMVSSPGHRVLVTQVFPHDDARLASDPVFGVTAALVGCFEDALIDGQPGKRLQHDFHLSPGEMVFPKPPIP